MKLLKISALVAASLVGAANAAVVHNSEIVGNVIYGGGNTDGGWTINQTGNMELALRAKVRYDTVTNGPKNVFNANGDGTFVVDGETINLRHLMADKIPDGV